MTDALNQQNWQQVVNEFRRLCLLRHLGSQTESAAVLGEVLPEKISSWARSNPAAPDLKKAQLEAMFRTEKQRIEDAVLLHEVTAARWESDVVPQLCRQLSREVRRAVSEQFANFSFQQAEVENLGKSSANEPRICFDDIPGIIDVLMAQDHKPSSLKPALAA